jgi:hypothetical protein
MKIMDWNTDTMTPEGQLWVGVIGSLMSLFSGILLITEPMATLDKIAAFWSFVAVPYMALIAWRAYQRRPKTGQTREI